MKIMVTGTHFTPAQAVITQLQKFPGVNIVYVGRQTTMEGDKTPSAESQVLPGLGVKFVPIIAGRVRRFISLGTFLSLLKIPIGFIQALWIVMTEQPKVLVSFGGYVAVPLVFWAWVFNIPVIIHEQTLISGLANTVSSFFASRIAVTFPRQYSFPKSKLLVTGNPIRQEILNPDGEPSADVEEIIKLKSEEQLPLVFITGGNQGSHFVNELVSDRLGQLNRRYLVIHQTGDSKYRDFENLSRKRGRLQYPDRFLVKKFFSAHDMGRILRQADLAVSRAGANTLLELALAGVPTIMIPIPFIHKDEQRVNAEYFAAAHLGRVLDQDGLTPAKLMEQVRYFVRRSRFLKEEAKKAKAVVIPDADKKLAQEIIILSR